MIPRRVRFSLARVSCDHSVVFGGFAAASLATRIDDARPTVMVTSDAGMRAGKAIPYKHLVDEALRFAKHPPAKVLIVDRGIDKGMARTPGRDVDYADARARHRFARALCVARFVRAVYTLHSVTTAAKACARHRRLLVRARELDAAHLRPLAPAIRLVCTSYSVGRRPP